MTSVSAVESVQTIEEFQDTARALRELQTATDAALRALEGAVNALLKSATAEEKKTLKLQTEGTLSTRLHLVETRRAALAQTKQLAQTVTRLEPVFAEDSFTIRLLEEFQRQEERVNAILSRSLESWSVRRLTAEDRSLLQLAITELVFFEDVPPAVIIDEYVELAKVFGDKDSTRLLNGVLDRVKTDYPRESVKE